MRILIAVLVLQAGCVRHIYPGHGKMREYKAEDYAAADEARTEGSLWSEGSRGLFEDARAARLGDIVTIKVDERADATRGAKTTTSRESSVDAGVSSFLGAMQRLARDNPDLSPASLIGAASSSDFQGEGSTSRSGALEATLPVRVKRVLQNGDFFVEGTKVILLNDEESQLYISGVVRPLDIGPDNMVGSSRLADVELEYTGRGVIAERQSPGWLARIVDYIWPF